ncbi:hypothetical protein BJ170DRAFT_614724 [Xylariales sp. AK1849]|nr:hypothetical protein BJ170DRAFT_614724 [Xylariales sp. AK1849]
MLATSATAAGDDGLPHDLKQRHRRTRTGCDRCRAQRRKCNEEKPRCRRCTDAGAACKYVAHISFLDKNARTISNDVVSKLSTASATFQYPILEFVINNDSSTQRKASGSPSNSNVTNCTGQAQEQRPDFETVPESQPVFLTGSSQHQPEDLSHPFPRKDVRNLEMDELGNTEDLSYRTPSSDPPQSLTNRRVDDSWPLAGRSSLSDDEVGLLKYYSHHVAPWLDVYDQSQTFRHLITQLAMTSPIVLEGILQLSAVFSGRSIKMVQRRGVGALHLQAMSRLPGAEPTFSDLRLLAGFVLVRTLLFVEAVPDTWEHSFRGDRPSFDFNRFDLNHTAQRQIWLSCLALISRLEIAYSLMNQTAPVMVPELTHQTLSLSKMYESSVGQTQKILDASLCCLGLLAEVMNLCHPASEAQNDAAHSQAAVSTLIGASRVARWKKLFHELWAWQVNRPPELQQLMESEGHEAAFPTVIFTSGAGISSNTLCHTAMFLLLSNRPQSISLAEWHSKSDLDAAQLSPLWHARRVCGIALNSDPEHTHCWDPCTIAAFSLVARRMTHLSQQDDIIACLSRVKVAGWHIDGLVQKLRDEWGPIGP